MTVVLLNDDDALDLSAYDETGVRIGIFGSSGSGKGWLLGRIVEDLIEARSPVIMLDPEGELWTFQEVGAVVIGGKHADAPFVDRAGSIDEAIRFGLETATPIVFDVQEIAAAKESDATEVGERIMQRLWTIIDDVRVHTFFACTEASIFAPQQISRGGARPEMMRQFLQRGRKRGLDSIIETQRMADIQKSVIGQCRITFVGYIDKAFDYDPVKREVGGRDFEHMRSLAQGTFFCTALDREVAIGPRKVTHGGGRPPEGEEITIRPRGRKRDVSALMKSLQNAATPPPPPGEGQRREHLATVTPQEWQVAKAARDRVPILEREMSDLRGHLAEAREQRDTEAEAGAGYLQEATALRREVEQARAFVENVADPLRLAMRALLGPTETAILMPDGTTAETFVAGSVTEERVKELIARHTPAGGNGVALMPVAKLREEFLERTAVRLVETIDGLDDASRQALLFMIAHPTGKNSTEIVRTLTGQTAGGSAFTRVSDALNRLAEIGIVDRGGPSRTWRLRLDDWVKGYLDTHDPTPQQVEQVRDRALSLVMAE